MKNNFLTVEDLISVFKQQKFSHFSSEEAGGVIKLRCNGMFDLSEDENDSDILNVWLKSCHIENNVNGSFIKKETMLESMPSFKGKPILGSIVKNDTTGEYDFNGHDMEICTDEDGNSYVNYIEQIIGTVSEIDDPYLEYDEKEDKTYVMVHGRIFDTYTRAGEIMRRRKTCSCSVELSVYEVSFDAKHDWLVLDKFDFSGVTILGENVAPGMKGASISIEKFDNNNNIDNFSIKLLETLEKLNDTISKFSINNTNSEEVSGKMNHFEELLAEWKVTVEDCDFDYEGMTDEELDAKFEEVFGCKKYDEGGDDTGSDETVETPSDSTTGDDEGENPTDDTTGDTDNGNDADDGENADEGTNGDDDSSDETDDVDTVDSDESKSKKRKYSISENGDITLTWELSHDDIYGALYNLICVESDYWNYIVEVFDDKFIYCDMEEGKYFRRGYLKDDSEIALKDDKVEVFSEWLTREERDALASMKSSYAELKKFKEDFDASALSAAKDDIFDRSEFAVLSDNKAFNALKADAEKYSVEEIEAKVKVILADFVIAGGTFAAVPENKKPANKIGINFNKPAKKKAYGNLFNE